MMPSIKDRIILASLWCQYPHRYSGFSTEPRDDHGRWTRGTAAYHAARVKHHEQAAADHDTVLQSKSTDFLKRLHAAAKSWHEKAAKHHRDGLDSADDVSRSAEQVSLRAWNGMAV